MPDPNNTVLAHKHLVFMMIAKAGNTSVMHAVRSAVKLPAGVSRADHFYPNCTKEEALDYRDRGFHVVSFVRNPFDRLVSCWEDKIRRRFLAGLQGQGMRRDMSFGEFAERVCGLRDDECPAAAQHFRGMCFDLVVDGELVPDLVGRVESFDDDWQRIRAVVAKDCGLDLGPPLHRNETPERQPTWRYYSAALRRRVAERFAEDLERFDYAFPG